ncbi:DUF504 domain-containing protein [Massilia sp. Dwa41.01b]|uniref:DUF504 domain-containing protein n=1 Tax=unclassified Massilia TaxID=2609279 RepID=UPI0015FFEA11|nr:MULTISPECIES: DUF504 domain-containing protein [unclassified Massilia]QNA90084.1 DUF504 domain-containing protein [Massilia sp. Dwa41.01b]QNB00974.1 DUF504 domain-containing protein [Massilia sp. Se16.2.3]
MTPIQDILHRILWDNDFGNAHFTIGYYDRVWNRIVHISFERIVMDKGQHFSFDLIGRDGVARMIPYHRVREVLRNEVVVWRRRAPA